MNAYWGQQDPNYRAKFGRLNRNVRPPCWTARNTRVGEYLQVDLSEVKVLTKVATQGNPGKYLTKYTISGSMDGQTWEEYKENDVVKVTQ